nr:ribonuclease H-like domain-containing protein [Tanacetum cinerariifolium]
FQKGDDPIDAINHMMSFLTAVVTLQYPPTNNHLRNSSNPRQQATINNSRVTIQPIQGRKTSMTADEAWFKDKVLLVQAQANGQVLHEEEFEFLADPGIAETQSTHVIQKTDAIVIRDSEKTLMLEDESRSKMLQKQKDPMMSEKKVNTKQNSGNSEETNLSTSTTIVEVPKELHKVSMMNSSLKKLKFHLARFDTVVKERTTATAITEGTVKFRNDHVAKIMGYGDYKIGNVIISKASKTKSYLWHRRLSHLNFGAINHLAKQGLVRGLPQLKFEKDHLCSACAMGKGKKKSHKPKSEDTNQEKLYLLHMDLCGPMRVESVNGKKGCGYLLGFHFTCKLYVPMAVTCFAAVMGSESFARTSRSREDVLMRWLRLVMDEMVAFGY